MKNYLPYIALFFLVNFLSLGTCRAQELDYTQVGLMKADCDHRAVLYLGGSQKMAAAILGPPSSKGTFFHEMENANLDVWTYGNSKLYFNAKGLLLFEIKDPGIAVGKNYATAFRVGTNRGTGATFHGLPVDPAPGRSRNLDYSAIAYASLKTGENPIPWALEVLCDASGNVFNIALTMIN